MGYFRILFCIFTGFNLVQLRKPQLTLDKTCLLKFKFHVNLDTRRVRKKPAFAQQNNGGYNKQRGWGRQAKTDFGDDGLNSKLNRSRNL